MKKCPNSKEHLHHKQIIGLLCEKRGSRVARTSNHGGRVRNLDYLGKVPVFVGTMI